MSHLIVVGGGPAGLATSIFAAQAGIPVTVLERGTWPIDKPCGEGLMPDGVRMLDAMGVSIASSFRFHGIRYLDESVGTVEATFTSGDGLGVRRPELGNALVARARELGVDLRQRTTVRDVRVESGGVAVDVCGEMLAGSHLVAADGLQSRIRAAMGLERASRHHRLRRYGFRRHYRVEPWTRFVEVHWARGAEAYVTPVGDDEVGVAFLWHERAPSYDAMLDRFPALSARLRGADVASSVKGAGPFRRSAKKVHQGRLALVGDAAGYVDAITGDGVALGFRGAHALVSALANGRGLASYERELRRLRRRHVVMTELALLMSTYPRLRRAVIGGFARRPGIFDQLVAVTARG